MNLPRQLVRDVVGESNVIADFGDEQWVCVDRPPLSVKGLAAIVLIDRAVGRPARCSTLDATSLTLLPHGVAFAHLPARELRRFELFGTVAASTPLLLLTADPSVPAATLADLVTETIQTL